MAELRFTFDSGNQQKEPFFLTLRQFAAQNHWAPAIANEVELIFEEWLTNLQNYGLAGNPNPQVRICLKAGGERARLEISDNGVPFDPTTHKDPDVNAPPDERPIGGLGIFMMKKLSHGLRYERRGEWNHLVIEKDLMRPVLSPKT